VVMDYLKSVPHSTKRHFCSISLCECRRPSRSSYQYHFVKRSFIVGLVLAARICMAYNDIRGIKTSSIVSSDASLVQTFEMESRK
jgi:hypothetical protein